MQRQPGAPLPGELVRRLREKQGLTPAELAARLGLRGGASLIADWETGRAVCEGPAAELLLHLFGGGIDQDLGDPIFERAEALWRRTGNWIETWRQVAAIPEKPVHLEAARFARLFPGTELPPDQHTHGFPFVDHDLPQEVYRREGEEWRGVIPVRDQPPAYLWLLWRDGRFLYREKIWEDEKTSVTGGHIHVGSLLEITAATVFFLRQLVMKMEFEAERAYRLHLDLHGMAGRAVVGQRRSAPMESLLIDEPQERAEESHLRAVVSVTAGRIIAEPLEVLYELVARTIEPLRPDLAPEAALEYQLRVRHRHDVRPGRIRFLGYLDKMFGPPRRGIVSLRGERVGIIEETVWGSRFTYDPEYVRPGAKPISPTLPVRREPYESRGLLPFFSNLLPEGVQRELIARRRKLDPNDAFGLLLYTGPGGIGAVEVRPETEW